MFMRRSQVFLAAIVLVLVLACGADQAPTPAATPIPTAAPSPTVSPASSPTIAPTPTAALFPLTVTGSNGAKVVLQRAPERIIAFDSAAVEILFALGEGRRVAGTHTYVTYPPEVAAVPRVGDAFNVNFEAIAQLKPDLVYIFFDRFVPDLEKLGVPVLYVKSPSTFAQVEDQMRMWGRIAGNAAAGDVLAREFKSNIDAFAARVADLNSSPTVYIDISPMLWTLGSGSLADEMLRLLRARNAFGDVSDAKQVSGEEIVARAPEVILGMYPGGGDEFKSDPAFASVPAVKNGRVCEVDADLVSAPGPRLVDGVGAIAKCVYPDRFR